MVKTKRDGLMATRAVELKQICKERGIQHYKGKNCFTKAEMVEAILKASGELVVGVDVGTPTGDLLGVNVAVVVDEQEQVIDDNFVDMEQKMPYIEQAEIGTIVAFRLPNGKVKSAKIVKRSMKNRRLMVETEYNVQYVVEYDDVVWVKTNKRWPRGVYRLLKGLVDNENEAQ